MVRWLRKALGKNWIAALIVLVVAIGAIVAIAWQIREVRTPAQKEAPVKVAEEKPASTQVAKEKPKEEAPQVQKKEGPKEAVAGEKKAQSYKFSAERGEGLTHLARKALRRYLTEEVKDITLTPEHKVYIEDYIQKKLGGRWLKLGEEVEISFDLIKEAIEASQKLTSEDLENLKKFSARVPSLIY